MIIQSSSTYASPPKRIDLNADVGEGYGRWTLGDDEKLMGVITSANVACGFHAGDPSTIRRTCESAARSAVSIGAQVAYPDLVGFGRRRMNISRADLANDVIYQIGGLAACTRAEGISVFYVKPHGALNNACDTDQEQAAAIADAIMAFDPNLRMLVIPGSELEKQAAARGIKTVAEAYPDRAYALGGRLQSRSEPDAVIHDVEEIVSRATRLAIHGQVISHDGHAVPVAARSLCLHGDNPAAVKAAQAIRDALLIEGIQVQSFEGE